MNGSREWSLAMGMLALGVATLGTSCLRVNFDHCMFAGGDLACDGGWCVGAVDGPSKDIAAADANGCIAELDLSDPPQGWVHVQYGLPGATMMADAPASMDAETDTIEGLMTRLLRERGLELDSSKEGCRDAIEAIPGLADIRKRIEDQDRKRTSVAAFTFTAGGADSDEERIKELNRRISDELLPMLEASCANENGTTGTTTGVDTTATEGASTTTTGVPECVDHEECWVLDPARPICDDGVCVGCNGAGGDAACAVAYPERPVCLTEGSNIGACVQCTVPAAAECMGMTPVCDGTTNTCVPCTAHDQCGGAACNLFDGTCLPAAAVVHVGAGQMYTTIGAAVMSFAAGAEGTIIVDAGDYNESVTVSGGRTLAFLAAELGPEVDPPRWVRTSGSAPQLTVGDMTGGATVLMDGLQVSGNASSMVPGIRVDDGRAWLDRSRIVDNNGGGIVAESGVELVLRNCFVGDGNNGVHGLTVDGATANVLYTTFGAGFDNFADAFPIFCSGAVDVTIRNSLLVSLDNAMGEISCPMAMVTNTASETLIPGTGNVALGDVAMNWFLDLNAGDFHLATTPPMLAIIAQWKTGDPTTDIDGDPRPTTNNTADFAGADAVP